MKLRDSSVAVELGRRVRARRLSLGVSQMVLAHAAGLHFTYISSIERGRRNVTLPIILRIAGALDLDPGKLVAGMSPPKDVRPCRQVHRG